MNNLKNYATITAAYWGFTLTDGALRMLVVLYFYQLGYSALEVTSLFLFYEFFGIVTNLFGGWLAARFGLNKTLFSGLILQIIALYLLSLESQLSIVYVMFVQAISGIAKDLNKMSAKSSLKFILAEDPQNKLFKWTAILTGSKNTLKGIGFFMGGALLEFYGYSNSLIYMAIGLLVIGVFCFILLSKKDLDIKKYKVKFKHLFSKNTNVNQLSFARFFLFGARDIWFVIALPIYLSTSLNWQYSEVGILMATWIIIYGLVQSLTPKLFKNKPTANTAMWACFLLLAILISMIFLIINDFEMIFVIIFGLFGFAIVFAINSAIHSFLILDYSTQKDVSLDVGFYYMANAAGRLLGTLLSGLLFQFYGFLSCIIGSALMIITCVIITRQLKNS